MARDPQASLQSDQTLAEVNKVESNNQSGTGKRRRGRLYVLDNAEIFFYGEATFSKQANKQSLIRLSVVLTIVIMSNLRLVTA